jgi:hypothetical protein
MVRTMLTQHRINEMWWAGYCAEAVRTIGQTDLHRDGEQRIAFMTAHVKMCEDGCEYAVALKSLEGELAETLGADGIRVFRMGGDVTRVPGAELPMLKILSREFGDGATESFTQWMETVAHRHGRVFRMDESDNG